MAKYITIAKINEIPEGTMKGFTVGNKQILVANVNGKFYATDALCPHKQAYLPNGKLKGNIVTCPLHGAQFDVVSGKVQKNINPLIRILTGGKGVTDLNTYEIKVEGNKIKVKI
jgi:nitrite reductase/ring-hydroxylating ferredoxin subunit